MKILSLALLTLVGACAVDDFDSEPLAETEQPLAVFCLPTFTTPPIYDARLVSPNVTTGASMVGFNPDFAVLARAPIYYASANMIWSRLELDQCSYIKEVRYGTKVATPTLVDGLRAESRVAGTVTTPFTRVIHEVFLAFPNKADGESVPVTIVVGRGHGTNTYTFTLTSVDKVNPTGSLRPVTVSDKEVSNALALGLFNFFGGAADEAIVTDDDGDAHRIYDLDHDDISLRSESGALRFDFSFMLETDWCDPRISPFGTFRLDKTPTGIFVDWVITPDQGIHWPSGTFCEVTLLIPIIGSIVNIFVEDGESDIEGSIGPMIKERVEAEIAKLDLGLAGTFVKSFSYPSHRLDINVELPFPSVDVGVPYGPVGSGGRTGVALNPGDSVAMLAHGLGINSILTHTGPNGLPNAFPTPPPIGESLTRTELDKLLWPNKNVAAVVAVFGSPLAASKVFYSAGCKVSNTSTTARKLNLGANDHITGPHSYDVTLAFLDDSYDNVLSGCESAPIQLDPITR